MYYPLGRLNVDRGIVGEGNGCSRNRLGHFTQIAGILQIVHTSLNPTSAVPPLPVFTTSRALHILRPYRILSLLNARLMLCEFLIASNVNLWFYQEPIG